MHAVWQAGCRIRYRIHVVLLSPGPRKEYKATNEQAGTWSIKLTICGSPSEAAPERLPRALIIAHERAPETRRMVDPRWHNTMFQLVPPG